MILYFKNICLQLYKSLLTLLVISLNFSSAVYAQRPQNLPYDIDAVDFTGSPFNIIVFIVLPIILFLFYIWWIYDKRKKAREEKERKEKEKASEHEDGNHD